MATLLSATIILWVGSCPTLLFDPALSSGDRPSHEFAHLVVHPQLQDDAFFIRTVHGVHLLTTTLHLSLKLSSPLFPLGVACGSCYCRRCIALLVGTLVLGRPPMLYCHVFGGLVCLEMYLLLFGVVLFASTQSSTQAPVGLLHPVEIPHEHFDIWSMDFITDLHPCGGFNGIYTCVNKLTKLFKLKVTLNLEC